MAMIRRTYGDDAQMQGIFDLAQKACQQVLQEQDLDLASRLEIVDISPYDGKKDVLVTVGFEVYPQVKLAPLQKLSLVRQIADIGLEKIDAEIALWSERPLGYVPRPQEESAQDKDRLHLEMQQPTEHQEAEPEKSYALVGAGRFPAEVEASFIGVCAGDTKTVTVPTADPDATAATTYSYKVLEIAKPQYPDLEQVAEMLKGSNAEQDADGSSNSQAPADSQEAEPTEILRKHFREMLEQQAHSKTTQKLKHDVFDAFRNANKKVECPEGLIASEQDRLKESASQNMKVEAADLPSKVITELEEQAQKNVHLSILLRALSQLEDLAPAQEHIHAIVEQDSHRYAPQQQEFRQWALENEDYMSQVRARAFEEKAFNYILEQAQVKEERVPWDQI